MNKWLPVSYLKAKFAAKIQIWYKKYVFIVKIKFKTISIWRGLMFMSKLMFFKQKFKEEMIPIRMAISVFIWDNFSDKNVLHVPFSEADCNLKLFLLCVSMSFLCCVHVHFYSTEMLAIEMPADFAAIFLIVFLTVCLNCFFWSLYNRLNQIKNIKSAIKRRRSSYIYAILNHYIVNLTFFEFLFRFKTFVQTML